ncbi:keratin, type I cytoskeletal 19-like [Bufo gargarizans]|uniref:keratin, type I cytoskeletal 19-like n=1 Tax=Bufo gargarizans TaxID=30331 RepID=UPI001CF2052B|nr:keratin, type I cytoskeletal 19-like [Bufo gargarizans]
MRYNVKKCYSPASSHKFNYGSFYFPDHGGSSRVYSTHKFEIGSGGASFVKSYKCHYSKSSQHERFHNSSQDHFKSSRGLGHKEKQYSSLIDGQSHGYVHDTKSYRGHTEDHRSCKTKGFLSTNEKETMHYLNERLESYLDKVHSLEQDNNQLEKKINEWYENNAPTTLPDTSQYLKTIEELQNQISTSTVENAKISLQVDNAKWATDDFGKKYDIELDLRRNVEADIRGLQRMLEELNMDKYDLDMKVRELEEELQQMKKNHEEGVNCLKGQLENSARINVELDAAPAVDLNRVLSGIREEYENLMAKNLREVEAMFLARSEELKREVDYGSSEHLPTSQGEIIELKRTVQTLDIDLQSQLSMKLALETTVTEKEASYSSQLSQLQDLINQVESNLSQIRAKQEHQNEDYKVLMDETTHLEREIATYRLLLDDQDAQ